MSPGAPCGPAAGSSPRAASGGPGLGSAGTPAGRAAASPKAQGTRENYAQLPGIRVCSQYGIRARLMGSASIAMVCSRRVFHFTAILIFPRIPRTRFWQSFWLKLAISCAGWRLPDDRMEFQANKHFGTNSKDGLLSSFHSKPPHDHFKLLGSKVSVGGSTHGEPACRHKASKA